MTKRFFGVGGLAALAFATVSSAQAQHYVEVSPDEAVLVERYVREMPPPPPVIVEHMTLRPGSVIPEGVPLRPFENMDGLKRLAYFVSVDHKIVVADPRTREVVRILDQKN